MALQSMFLGPMPARDFIKVFLEADPDVLIGNLRIEHPRLGQAFRGFSDGMSEVKMCSKMKIIQDLKLCPGMVYQDCPNNHDPESCDFRQEPGAMLYSSTLRPESGEGVSWSRGQMAVEFKSKHSQDAFVRDPKFDIRKPTYIGDDDVGGQMSFYAAVHMAAAHRTHVLLLSIFGEYARFTRWDRSACVASEEVRYKKDPYLFTAFLRAFSQASQQARGWDSTVRVATGLERLAAVRAAKRLKPDFESIFKGTELVRLKVPQRDKATPVICYSPARLHYGTFTLTGKATRGLIAVDVENDRILYVKDTWRIAHPGMSREGDLYEDLETRKVPNVPRVVAHGDLEGPWHQTCRIRLDPDAEWISTTVYECLSQYQHYRFAMQPIARTIEEFKTSRELVSSIRGAIEAWKSAYDDGEGILHRDISTGNVLISEENGLLGDWDLSRPVRAEKPQSARRRARTGTWQFISAKLLMLSDLQHTGEDDLESFVHVLCYVALARLPSNLSKTKRLSTFFSSVYDYAFTVGDDTPITGGVSKARFFTNYWSNDRAAPSIEFNDNTPLTDLILSLRKLFARRYICFDEDSSEPPVTADEVLAELDQALRRDGWPEDDAPADQFLGDVQTEKPVPPMGCSEADAVVFDSNSDATGPRAEAQQDDDDAQEFAEAGTRRRRISKPRQFYVAGTGEFESLLGSKSKKRAM